MSVRKQIVKEYFEAWISSNSKILHSLFTRNVFYKECHGKAYDSIEQVCQWFDDWHFHGDVIKWDIKKMWELDDEVIVKWHFHCRYQNKNEQFDGVSIVTFNEQNLIMEVHEYAAQYESSFPYQSAYKMI